MTAPATDLHRILLGLALGYGLGAVYCFLRPLRPRYTALSDLLFLPPAFYVWLYHSFAVCQADLRFGYTLSLFVGGWLFILTLGRFLTPVFRGFWRILFGIGHSFLCKIRKIFEKGKKCCIFLLATKKKTVKIDARQRSYGGDHMASIKNPFRNVRVVYHRSSKRLKIIVLVTLVVATVALLLLGGAIHQEKEEFRQMQQQAMDKEQTISELDQQIEELGTVEAIKRLARKFFGLEDPNTVIFLPEE